MLSKFRLSNLKCNIIVKLVLLRLSLVSRNHNQNQELNHFFYLTNFNPKLLIHFTVISRHTSTDFTVPPILCDKHKVFLSIIVSSPSISHFHKYHKIVYRSEIHVLFPVTIYDEERLYSPSVSKPIYPKYFKCLKLNK